MTMSFVAIFSQIMTFTLVYYGMQSFLVAHRCHRCVYSLDNLFSIPCCIPTVVHDVLLHICTRDLVLCVWLGFLQG